MPAAPEIGNALRKVGIVEVFAKIKPQRLSEPDGHVGIG